MIDGYTAADWLFIGVVLLTIVVCVAASDLKRKK
jgi:hypothetical protein